MFASEREEDDLGRQLEEGAAKDDAAPSERKPGAGRSMWEANDAVPCDRDLLTLFVRNQLSVSLALPAIAVLFAAFNLMWIPWVLVLIWLACTFASQGVQLYLCRIYDRADKSQISLTEWIGALAASEFLFASCWSLPLYIFWIPESDVQHFYLVATLLTVVAVRIIIASNFMPIVLAGTGFITFAIAIRCLLEGGPEYIALGALSVLVELFFIQLAQRLQSTARDMLIFKSQREQLITELKAAKAVAERDRAFAEEANRAKSRFLATMSHELRTPLNAIMGFSEILSHEILGPHTVEAYKGYSVDIHHSGSYLLNLINDILDLSRIEAGKFEISDAPIAIPKLADECAKLLIMKVMERGHTLRIDIPETAPKVLGDERSVRQIWLNLLSNAIKFTPPGGIIDMAVVVHDNGSLSMIVRDSGPGIPQHEISNALGAFTRGSLATRRAIDGAGLGLPIVNGLAKLHGAELAITSRPGAGTEVSVTFPPRRVLSGPRAEVLQSSEVKTPSQKRLIALTA